MADNPIDGQSAEEEVSWEDAFNEMNSQNSQPASPAAASPLGSAFSAGSSSLVPNPNAIDLDFLLDIKLNVTAEIGRTRMPIEGLLQLNQGSIVELEKPVGESIDVFVNNKLMARGEVVVINEKFGIRLTDIIGPQERIQQLR